MIKKGFLHIPSSRLTLLVRLSDIVGIGGSGWLAHVVVSGRWRLEPIYALVLTGVVLLSVSLFAGARLYETWRGQAITKEIRALLAGWLAVFFILAAVALVTHTGETFSRRWLGCWFLGGALLLVGARVGLRYLLRAFRARDFNIRTVVLVGNNALAGEVTERVVAAAWTGFRILGCFSERQSSAEAEKPVADIPILGGLDALADYVERHRVDQVWFALPWDRQDAIAAALYELRYATADVRMIPDIFSYHLLNQSLTEVAGMPVINLSTTPMDSLARLTKSVEDRILAFLVLMLIWPLLVLIGLGMKLTSEGPVLFKQRRHGHAGQEVEIWKFRTMIVHEENDGQVTQARRNDPRVTRFGAFLRRSSLDELPQFINVLQGRMSIVGPRPHALAHTTHYKEQVMRYMLRHKVKPGITGWAQINGYRGQTHNVGQMVKRIEHDLYYIENWSLWLDLKIIFLTLFKGFRSQNAY